MKKIIYLSGSIFLTILLFVSMTLMAQNPYYVDVIQPDDANIDWVVGESYLISWDDNLTQTVDIKLYKNGVEFSTLATSVVGSTWSWDIDGSLTAASDYSIRVESSVSPLVYYNDGANFELVYALDPAITVYQPTVTGISWAWNTTHLITWSDNISENVEIWLYNPNTTSWVMLTPAGGVTGSSWAWTIPMTTYAESAGYKIRVVSVDHSTVLDESDNPFTITETSGDFEEIYQPTAASSWAKNTTHLISWRDELNEPVDLYYKKSGGSEVSIVEDVVGSTYAWTVPNTVGFEGTYTIILKSSIDEDVNIESSSFAITATTGSISAIYQPLASASWAAGTTHLISWLDNLSEPVDVYYNNGTVDVLIDADVVGSTCSWTVPTGATTGADVCKIIVKSSIDADINMESDLFDIIVSTGTNLTVIQPSVSGISWVKNTTHVISWDDNYPENITSIDLIKYDDATTPTDPEEKTNITTDAAGSTYDWNIVAATYPVHGYYKVRLTSVSGQIAESGNTFAITNSSGTYVEVLQPNGGEYWMQQTSHWIHWSDDFAEDVDIDLIEYDDDIFSNEVGVISIATDVSGSGYIWDIVEATYPVGEFYTVRVTSVESSALVDESDAVFEIIAFGKSAQANGDNGIDEMVSVYPNPANGQFTIFAPVAISKIEVRNMLGQIIYSTEVDSTNSTIDISGFDTGLYIVNVFTDGNTVAKKLFIR